MRFLLKLANGFCLFNLFRLVVCIFPLLVFSNEGIEYFNSESKDTWNLPLLNSQAVHVVIVDPSKYDIFPARALNLELNKESGLGRETVLSIAKRHNAICGINGGFFDLDGLSKGSLKIKNWIALPYKPRGSIGWSKGDFTFKMDRLWVSIQGKKDFEPFSIHGLNRPRKEGEIVLFLPNFNNTTRTNSEGEEIIVKDHQVVEIRRDGNSEIPEDGFVLSIDKDSPLFNTFCPGSFVDYLIDPTPQLGFTFPSDWTDLDYIVGGAPLLIHHGFAITDFQAEECVSKFLDQRHARTALGILPNHHLVFVVVDKNCCCNGMTIRELSTFMQSLGCTHALNLDGGSSSTLVYEGEVKNWACQKEEMLQEPLVSDAILVCKKTNQ